jgi:hypothetical protein
MRTPPALLLVALVVPIGAAAQTAPFVEDLASPLVQGAEASLAALWGDYDGDGDLDLLVTDADDGALDNLYRNEGEEDFTLIPFVTNDASLAITNAGTWADLQGDGELDLITSALNDGSVFVNRGSGGGTPDFDHRPTQLDNFENQRSVDLADYNGDGLLDGVILRRFGYTNLLVRNDVRYGMVVANSAVSTNHYDSSSSCWGDVNNDRWPDLYVANSSFDPNEFFRNVSGVLQPVTNQPILNDTGRSQGCSWGDYDNDGDLDLVVTNYEGPDRLFRFDDGTAVLVDLDDGAITRTFGSTWGDVDNDGDLDLVVNRDSEPAMFFLNKGNDDFASIPLGDASDGYGVAATLVDDDQDGDLDLYLTYGGFNFAQPNHLYRNTTDGEGNWLEVDLRRTSGRNRFGIGAHVYAYATVDGAPRTMLRPVLARSGRAAQEGGRVHFGLGDATAVDSLVVVWPRGVGEGRTVLYDVEANQLITVSGGTEVTAGNVDVEASAGLPASFAVEEVYPNPSPRTFTLTVRSGGDEPVRVAVLDVLGRRVAALEAEAPAGAAVRLVWVGTDDHGQPVAPGLYLLRVQQGADEEVAKVTLMR